MKVLLLSAVLLASARGFFWSTPVEDLSGYSHDDGYLAFWYAFAAQCDYTSVLETWTNGVPHAPDDMVGFQLYDVIRTVGVLPGGLQSYVGWDNTRERIVVAFRGSDNADNWIRTNLNLIPDSYPNAAVLSDPKLHPGFYGAFKELEEAGIVSAMGELTAQHPGANVFVTGHSLGGALASIAALEFVLSPEYSDMDIGQVDIITFGSVRVFNEELATHFNDVMDSSWRIVNRYDLAVTVPIKAMGYYHVGTEVWYNYRRWWWEIDELEFRVCDGSGEDTTCFGTDFWVDRIPMWTHHSQYMGMQTDPRKDMICRSAPGSISAKKTEMQEDTDEPMFGVTSLKAKKETTAREDVDATSALALSAANKAEINEIGTSDIALIANWATIVSTGLGIIGLGSSDHGATIKVSNYLCGGELRAKGAFHLVKGSFRAHCETVRSGTSAGCTATGGWNSGLYGIVQYNFLTAVPGYEQCAALNVYVQASQGWFGRNSVDVFWSRERCSNGDKECLTKLRRVRDGKFCWTSHDTYNWGCTSDWDDPDAVALCNGLEAVARIGSSNNPTVTIEVRATSDPIGGTCAST